MSIDGGGFELPSWAARRLGVALTWSWMAANADRLVACLLVSLPPNLGLAPMGVLGVRGGVGGCCCCCCCCAAKWLVNGEVALPSRAALNIPGAKEGGGETVGGGGLGEDEARCGGEVAAAAAKADDPAGVVDVGGDDAVVDFGGVTGMPPPPAAASRPSGNLAVKIRILYMMG